jgi:hypothetical protein
MNHFSFNVMDNLWGEAHRFLLFGEVGHYYRTGDSYVHIVKRTPQRIYLSNGSVVSLGKSKSGFFYFKGNKVNQILRDIEGYLLFLKHDPLFGK